ncbi:MAG: hypothetical protein ACYTDT_13280 [Planctomycetota bacterium]|jgi:hypothetical protein
MSDDKDKPFALRDPMRQLDAAFAIARKMKHSTGEVPEGMMEDIAATLKRVEKAFVLDFDNLKPDIQKRIRKLIKNTKRLDHSQIGDHLASISRSIRHLLNHVLMNSDLQLTITDELGEVPSLPTEDFDIDDEPAAESPPVSTKPSSVSNPPRTASPKILYGAIIGVLCIMGASVALFGPWNRPEIPDTNSSASTNTEDNSHPLLGNEKEPEEINYADFGYPDSLDNALLDKTNPLDLDVANLRDDQLLYALLGIEYQISLAEPDRMNLKYEDLERRLSEYTKSAISNAPKWRTPEVKPFLEAFIEFSRSEMELSVLEDADDRILISDMLYSAGGSRYALAILYRVLAACTEAPIELLAPNGPSRPVVGQTIGESLYTFNGESFGSRASAPKLKLSSLMKQTAALLYPSMITERGRLLVAAWLVHFGVGMKPDRLRELLAEFDASWRLEPADGNETDIERARAANLVFPYMCDQLLAASGTAEEALTLFKLANLSKDKKRSEAALLALGERAQPRATLDGEPLALRIAENFFEQKLKAKAVEWWKRALSEFPENSTPALRLSTYGPKTERDAMLFEAYRRGDHGHTVLRRIIEHYLKAGDQLAALAIYDELCEEAPDPVDLQGAVLLCLEMGKTEWALARLTEQSDVVNSEPALQRLDLICELQTNGYSERAAQLAEAWRETNPKDPWLKGLLERHGG